MEKVLITTILVIIDSGETHQWMSNHWLGDSWGEEYSHSLQLLSSKREKYIDTLTREKSVNVILTS